VGSRRRALLLTLGLSRYHSLEMDGHCADSGQGKFFQAVRLLCMAAASMNRYPATGAGPNEAIANPNPKASGCASG